MVFQRGRFGKVRTKTKVFCLHYIYRKSRYFVKLFFVNHSTIKDTLSHTVISLNIYICTLPYLYEHLQKTKPTDLKIDKVSTDVLECTALNSYTSVTFPIVLF